MPCEFHAFFSAIITAADSRQVPTRKFLKIFVFFFRRILLAFSTQVLLLKVQAKDKVSYEIACGCQDASVFFLIEATIHRLEERKKIFN